MTSVPFSRDPWSHITPLLAIGGHYVRWVDGSIGDVVVAHQFDLVLSFHQRYGCGPGYGVERHYAYIPDGVLTADELDHVRRFARLGADAVRAGRKVLARCQAGYNRSALLAAFILLRLGHTSHEAIHLVREARGPYTLFNASFVDLIHAEDEPAPTIASEATT